jgi:hypothetical protein
MSVAEKTDLLVTVRSEISSEPENIKVPQWHMDILDEREEALNSGRERLPVAYAARFQFPDRPVIVTAPGSSPAIRSRGLTTPSPFAPVATCR